MKRVILSVFVVGALLATSCKNTKEEAKDAVETVEKATEEAKEAATEETKEATEEAAKAVGSAIEGVEIPEFEDPKVGEYLQSYAEYAKTYIDAKGDVVKNSELAQKGVELAKKSQDILGNLSQEDAVKFSEVMTAIQSKMAPAQ
ncbi:hypothetical protein [Tenacibaculum sp. SDUM215027]|uniref:hypothetical protein n=1 Tax=Tenacibaculum sp. SDUM215027 TaxID=3422596 RepID=UPI003D321F9A